MNSENLEKFTRHLAIKAVQVVVQSRLGEKMITDSNPLSKGDDWFNIVCIDHPEVLVATKKALAMSAGESIFQRLPICVEISLQTVEGDKMTLEVWSLDYQPLKDTKGEKFEIISNGENSKGVGVNGSADQIKPPNLLYPRMTVLLKSIITLTRALPAYKLSRQQSKDSYKIYYNIYVDRPRVYALGEGYKCVRIGQLMTSMGTLSSSVSYRTKMTITPTVTTHVCTADEGIMLKSDHFRPSDSTDPQQRLCAAVKKGGTVERNAERKIIDIEKPVRHGAFTDLTKLTKFTDKDYGLRETPPFEWLLQRTRDGSSENGSIESLSSSPKASPISNGQQNNCTNNSNAGAGTKIVNNKNECINNNNNIAFKSFEDDENTRNSSTNSTLSQSPIRSLLIPTPLATRHSSEPTLPPEEDNLLKELNFPFASPTSHVNDLAKFYRDCYHAPPLRGLGEIQPESSGGCAAVAYTNAGTSETSAVDDLSRQLEQFETSLDDYDKLVSQLGLTASSSTGSRSSGGGLQMSN